MNKSEKAYFACLNKLEESIAISQQAMKDIEESAQNETKSSAGDKFETGRAMMHRDKEKIKIQLINLMAQKHQMQALTQTPPGETIGLGKFVSTNIGEFYIGVGLGKIKTPGLEFMAVSSDAPLVKKIMGLKKGDHLDFNGRTIHIKIVE